jgi:hypothetical protein
MPTIYLDSDERYPNYSFSRKGSHRLRKVADVPEEKLREWERIRAEETRMQEELEALYDAAEWTP